MRLLQSRRSLMQTQSQDALRVMKLFGVLALTLLVTSCAGSISSPGNCAGWSPAEYELSDVEVISDTLALWLVAHDRHYRETCG